jgi:hypothetical protein
MKFYSQVEVIKYMRDLAEGYQKESEIYGDKLGLRLRPGTEEPAPKEEKKQDKPDKEDKKTDQKAKPIPGGWVRMGSFLLNTITPGTATTEVMYQIYEDLKQKLGRTNEALRSFELNASTLVPQNAIFQLYVRNGVPERIIVEVQEVKKIVFSYEGKFRVVQ